MRRHPTIIGVIGLGAVLSIFVGYYYVHLKPVSIPPFAPAATYSPEQFHHVVSKAEKKRVLDDEFTVVRSTEEIPHELKQAFAAATGQQQFALANPGQKYQVTDVIDEPGLPVRRLLFAGESRKSWFIHYESGGIGHSYAMLCWYLARHRKAECSSSGEVRVQKVPKTLRIYETKLLLAISETISSTPGEKIPITLISLGEPEGNVRLQRLTSKSPVICSKTNFASTADSSHSASRPWRAKGITYISGSRIFSTLEVAGDVFSRADVGQQLVEPRRRAL
jgi:hypothetical protein